MRATTKPTQHQLTFELPAKTALGRDDFFVSSTNAAAVEAVEDWENWTGGKLLLIGSAGSGKTHLAHVWAAETGSVVLAAKSLTTEDIAALVQNNSHIVVEDIDLIAGQRKCEEALFHLHNLLLAEGGRLLMTATNTPEARKFTLPDLASRVQGTARAILMPADDLLLSVILVKLFSDRQLVVKPAVIDYLVKQMDRSFDAVHRLVDLLDRTALAERRAITKPLVARVLETLSTKET